MPRNCNKRALVPATLIAPCVFSGRFHRIGKYARDVYLQATYNPIFDLKGDPVKVIKFATDITAQKIHDMEADGKVAAIDRAQAVIEFNMDGTIVTA